MVNIKFSTRYLVDMLFSRHITSSRRIRTNRKRLAMAILFPLTGKFFTINSLERDSLTGFSQHFSTTSVVIDGSLSVRCKSFAENSSEKSWRTRSRFLHRDRPIREGVIATALTPSLSRALMKFTIEYQHS